MVDDRDGRRCVRCGRSLYAVGGSRHHRKLRSQCTRVEKHQVQNLILLCGSGTTGCHGFVHMHPTIAYENGWCVKSFQDQLEVPVRTWHGLVYLTTDGKYLRGATEGICESLMVEGVYQPVIISVNAGGKHVVDGVKALNILKEVSA